ncbi:hypothetical protein [Teredinibacter turnerae]|nr:hypothetical protein [Teredinibacter turnerae]
MTPMKKILVVIALLLPLQAFSQTFSGTLEAFAFPGSTLVIDGVSYKFDPQIKIYVNDTLAPMDAARANQKIDYKIEVRSTGEKFVSEMRFLLTEAEAEKYIVH